MTTYTLQFTERQLWELGDAMGEVMHRMMHTGQTSIEIREQSLAVLWATQIAITKAMFGDQDTPGIEAIRPQVEQAIAAPKVLDREHAYLGAGDR